MGSSNGNGGGEFGNGSGEASGGSRARGWSVGRRLRRGVQGSASNVAFRTDNKKSLRRT